jgi:hypothetical protein
MTLPPWRAAGLPQEVLDHYLSSDPFDHLLDETHLGLGMVIRHWRWSDIWSHVHVHVNTPVYFL